MTDRLERRNADEIRGLNQRGGRMMSIVDLIEAGTISDEMAGFCLWAIANGASFLTAARPGGVGKTTVLAALLGFLPPDTEIVSVDSPAVLAQARKEAPSTPRCYLPHEIGSGHWYGYIWGQQVSELFDLKEGRRRIASCIHVDTMEELAQALTSPPLQVAEARLRELELALFLAMDGGHLRPRRRVSSLCEATGRGRHHELFRWDARSDSFPRSGESALLALTAERTGRKKAELQAELDRCTQFIRDAAASGARDFEAVRAKVVDFYKGM